VDYLNNAPHNLAFDLKWQRYHQYDKVQCKRYGCPTDNIGFIYEGAIDSSHVGWMEHPRVRVGPSIWQYTESILRDRGNDKRARYVSEKYPYIFEAYVYTHVDHQTHDQDLVKFTIEPREGYGRHFVVQWSWGGYYDCSDVQVFDEEVENVYGIVLSDFVWNRIDHCQFLRIQSIDTSCMEAPGGRLSYTINTCLFLLPLYLIDMIELYDSLRC